MAEVNHATENGHWYDKDGNPAYTVVGKNGKERPTTLRDARKLGLLPSVTSIIRCAAAPGLENWKAQQVLLAALTTDRLPDETEQDYIARIIKDSQEQALKARERGTLIHAYVQDWFEGNVVDPKSEAYPFVVSARDTVFNEIGNQEWICEKPFALYKYGGKADLHTSLYLIDIKTTDKPIDGLKLWDDHYLQLAAYRRGLDIEGAVCGILYINSVNAESKLIWAEEKELVKGWKCFKALLDFYYAKTGLGGE
jgi:hypothetical protein